MGSGGAGTIRCSPREAPLIARPERFPAPRPEYQALEGGPNSNQPNSAARPGACSPGLMPKTPLDSVRNSPDFPRFLIDAPAYAENI